MDSVEEHQQDNNRVVNHKNSQFSVLEISLPAIFDINYVLAAARLFAMCEHKTRTKADCYAVFSCDGQPTNDHDAYPKFVNS